MKHSLHLQQKQSLIMTPRLQQALKLLQVPTLELQAILKQEVLQNPLLEEVKLTGVRLVIGDVVGKGLPALQSAATLLGLFREAAYEEDSLGAIAGRIEASLAREFNDEQFATAILAQVSSDGDQVELLNCGHPQPACHWG